MKSNLKKIEIIGHRGDFYKKVENTLESLHSAWQYSHGIETDVQLTKDGILALYHDDYLGGAGFFLESNKETFFSECSLAEIKKCSFNQQTLEAMLSKKACSKIKLYLNKIPRINILDEIIPITKNKKIFLELKCSNKSIKYKISLAKKCADWIKKNDYYANVIIISFEKEALDFINSYDKKISLGLNINKVNVKDLKDKITLKHNEKVNYILPPYIGTNENLIKQCNQLKVKIYPWVWNENLQMEEKEFSRLINLGVDGIITNQPQKLSQIIKS